MHRPVEAGARGRWESLTPEIDKAIESNMDRMSVLRTEYHVLWTQNAKLEAEKARVLEAYQERKVLCLDDYRRPARNVTTKPPCPPNNEAALRAA